MTQVWSVGRSRAARRGCASRCYASRGLTLLEVMVAIAILGTAMAAVGELVRIGVRNAARARDLTTAQLICEAKLAEVVSGVLPLKSSSQQSVQDYGLADPWVYSVDVQAVDKNGLLAVQVLVRKDVTTPKVEFTLVRWMLDPQVESKANAAAQGSGSSTGQASGTSSPTAGGSNGP